MPKKDTEVFQDLFLFCLIGIQIYKKIKIQEKGAESIKGWLFEVSNRIVKNKNRIWRAI